MGTSTVLEYIRKYGDENISSFVILDMTPKMVNDDEWKMGLFHGKYTLEEAQKNLTTLNDNMSAFLEEFVRICLPYFSDEEVAATMKLASKNTPFVMSALWYAMVVADYRDVLDKISVPTKICYGEKSTLYSKETAEYFASRYRILLSSPLKTAHTSSSLKIHKTHRSFKRFAHNKKFCWIP